MAVVLRERNATQLATAASFTCNLPAGITNGEKVLLWVAVPTGKTLSTPSGFTLLGSGDSGGVAGYLFGRTWSTGDPTAITVTPNASTDGVYASVSWSSSATSGYTLGWGQQGYTGTGADPVDSGDTYTYSNDGKLDVDNAGDTTLGVFSGGMMAYSDLPIYFYAARGATAPTVSVGGEDTQSSTTAPTTTAIRAGYIYSSYRAGARGFTLSVSSTTVAFGTWLSENASTGGGGGPGGNGTVNFPPSLQYLADDVMDSLETDNGTNLALYWASGARQNSSMKDSMFDGATIHRGDGRAAIAPGWRDAVQPEQGASINVV